MDSYHHALYPATGPMPAEGPKVVPASTIIIFRKGRDSAAPEFLMVQRAKEMRFAGGAAVFPGGRRFRLPMLMAALSFYAIRDRL